MKISIKKKILLLWSLSILSGATALNGLLLLTVTEDPEALFRLVSVYRTIQREYFHHVSDGQLFEGASRGMVEALEDPYSQFLAGRDFEKLQEQTSGEYGGIGVVIGTNDGTNMYILSVFPGSAAENAGLLPGDQVVAVNGRDTLSMDLVTAADTIRGRSGTDVEMTILRQDTEHHVVVTRSNICLPTVDGRMVTDSIGYIHIYSFATHTPDEFKTQYEQLLRQGMAKLLLDVRMNPGGLIDSVVAVAGQILSGGPIVSYQEKNGPLQSFSVPGTSTPLPMAVLIDRNSASASEILAGAIQDRGAGILVGERTFGKGTVQIVQPMDGGEALKLSVAQYLTAAGRRIDKIGIQPDVPVFQTGRIFDPASDNVWQTAIEVLEGKHPVPQGAPAP